MTYNTFQEKLYAKQIMYLLLLIIFQNDTSFESWDIELSDSEEKILGIATFITLKEHYFLKLN